MPSARKLRYVALGLFLLIAIGWFARSSRTGGPESGGEITSSPAVIAERAGAGPATDAGVPALSPEADPAPQAAPAPAPQADPGAPTPPVAADWIKRTIAAEWIDGPDKLAGRQRVRIVEADFKYPFLRIEEAVTLDPATGEETVTFLRASVADHLLLGLKPGVDAAPAAAAVRAAGYQVRAIEPDSHLLAVLPEFEAAADHDRAAAELAALEEFINHAEPDYLVFPCAVPNDPGYAQGKLWGLHNPGTSADSTADADIDAPEGWAILKDAPDVVVAVTDTGIQYTHEDLAGNLWTHPSNGSHGFDAYDDDNDPMDVGGHGTHCAGTIGAQGNNAKGLTGVAWEVQLMGVRFLGPNGGTTSDAIRAVNYSRQNGAHLISASWGGGGFSQSLFDAIKACGDAGIPFVAAAGNSSANNDATPHYPSSYKLGNIIAVASTTKKDQLSTFSCYGKSSVDIGAPGSSIWSSYTGSNTAYTFLNGTSMATPHVSGALALAIARFPGESMTGLIDRLYASADKIPALSGKCTTGGRLNLARLLGGSPPGVSNDDFANAHRIEGHYGSWTGSNAGATREADENQFSLVGIGNKSLWLAFHTAHTGLVSIDVTNGQFDFEVVVFEGSEKGQLKVVAHSYRDQGFNREIRFTSKPGTEYRVVLDTYLPNPVRWEVDYTLAPPNDFFADATPLTGDLFVVKGYNRAATSELFERLSPHADRGRGKSAWWRWTAPFDGDFTINTSGSAFDTVLAVYTGTATNALTEIASNDDRLPLDYTSQVGFTAVAGTTYHIAVDSCHENAFGDIALNGFRSNTLQIIRQPQDLRAAIGKRAVFDVTALSATWVTYQWFFNGQAIPGQTGASLVIDPVRQSDFGTYHVEARNNENLVVSDPAVLSEAQSAPKLTWSSGNQAVASGTAVVLAAEFSGSTPMTYAWTKNGAPVAGDSPSLSLPSAQSADAGAYRLTATNSAGSATADFSLTVVNSPWERWEWRRPGVPNPAITDIKVHDGEAFAVAATTLLRSTDGVNWRKSVFPQGFTANSIAKAGSLFVCIGVNLTNQMRVATSSDNAATWTTRETTGFDVTNLPGQSTLISHGNAFIARSSTGFEFLRSTDGVAWTRLKTTNLAGQLTDLTGKGTIASNGTRLILASTQMSNNSRYRYHMSTDGITWAEYETQAGGTAGGTRFPRAAYFDGTKFHLFCIYSIYTSADGENWTYHNAPSNAFSENSRFATCGSTLVAFQANSQAIAYYDHPDDRRSISLQPANSHAFTAAATFGGKALYGTDKGLLALAAGPFEVTIPRERASTLASVEFTEGLFIARTQNGASSSVEEQVSGDGVTWKPSTLLDGPAVKHTGSAFGRYFGMRDFQYAVLSGHNPFDVRTNADYDIGLPANVTFVGQLPNGSALAVSVPNTGGATLNRRAAGASSWTPVTSPAFPLTVNSALKFSAIGNRWISSTGINASVMHTSADGATWASTGINATSPQFTTMGGKSWCIYQSASFPMVIRTAYSTNGTSWPSLATTGFPADTFNNAFIKRLAAFGEYLVAVGADENLYFSQDGAAWFRGSVPGKVVDVAGANGQLVAVMKNGGIIQTGAPHPGRSAPLVRIVSPQTAGTHLIGSRITIEGTVSDPEEGTATYECHMDSQLVASGTGNSFRFTVTATDLNGHTVTVRARDSHGLRQIDAVRLKVVPPEPENLLSGLEGETYVPHTHATAFDGVFYAAGSRNVYRSRDGRTWERVPIPSFANPIYGMASGNGSLVIQFDNGGIITTRDGVNWTHFQPNLTSYWVREPVRFEAGRFIAAYQTQGTTTGSVMTSTDGLIWQAGAVSLQGYLSWSATNGTGTIIGAAAYQTGVYRTIDDGFNWIPVPQITSAGNYNSRGVYGGGTFVVAATGSGKLHASPDGISWSEQPLPAGVTAMPALCHLGGRFFLGRTPDLSHSSVDGVNWQPLATRVDYLCITHARGLFLAQASTGGLVTSRDGIEWQPVPAQGMPSTYSKILSSESAYLAIDTTGGVWSSADALEWSALLPGQPPVSMPITGRIGRSIAELNGKLVVSGSGIAVTSADDGRSWTNVSLDGLAPSTSATYLKVVSSGTELLLIQTPSTLRRSTDASAFTTVPGLPAKTWMDLASNGPVWMLVANDGTVMRSTDGGLTWAQVPTPGLLRASGVAWFNNRWIIIGSDLSSTSTPHKAFTLEAGDVFQLRSSLGSGNSSSAIRILAAHGRLVAWQQGDSPYVSTDGLTWARGDLAAGAGNSNFDIHHTPDGLTAFVPSSTAYYPVRTWKSGPDGLVWREVPSEFNNIQFSDNLGGRIFLFASHSIAELHDKDLALTLPAMSDVTLGVGDEVAANVTVTNFGRAIPPGGTWKVTAWLAKNRFYGDTRNIPLGTFEITAPMPAPGTSQSYPVSFTLPNHILTGGNFLILSLSGPDAVRETNTANNTVISDTAFVTIPEWEFSVATNGNGQVNRDFAALRYPHKAQVSLTATAGKGAVFTGWAGDAFSPNNQITILMDDHKSVAANFSNRAFLQVFVQGAGSVNGLADLGSYPPGSVAQLTAVPAPGWSFSHWSGASDATTPATDIPMNQPETVTAHFILPLATWKSGKFSAAELADPLISGNGADPDQDGVTNWREYLHGSHPMQAGSRGASTATLENAHLRVVYTRNLGAEGGFSLACEAGRSLAAWNAPDLKERILSTVDGIETVEALLPVNGHGEGFLRFRYPPPP